MHELGLCDALLRMVDETAKEEELEKVLSVTIEIGTLSGVVPKYMEDSWEAVVDGTPYRETKLRIEAVEGTALCLDCGLEFTPDLNKLSCPNCRGNKLKPLTGRELTLKEIEAL